ncbi:LytR/AlgR family response regulator transcription factor [Chitinophaga varians]|uniref:LytR/AlgR family response regulator transcription factor n=1 Tax=Chitinophaga varians TaxID=2202339 RepID=UPI00165F4B34|nr:LytTR family DNA-binding domain-containing protein [Chitinophaga varians]MBC9913027.1 response regulator transcription factor [Chitinophaga varians]
MKCIVVDDEPLALALTQRYIEQTPQLQLAGSFTNPFKAMDYLLREEVQLLFLDIHMPGLSGMHLLASLPVQPMVVFTTAYAEFGAESYDYNAVDYLLKPINYPRFLKAVNKAIAAANVKSTAPPAEEEIVIKSGAQWHRVRIDSILYIEAAGNYMQFHLSAKKLMALMNMNELMELLPTQHFIRIHKSYVVSLRHITMYEKNMVMLHTLSLPIGLTYRQQFLDRLNRK